MKEYISELKKQCSSQFGTSTYRAALRSKGQVATPAFASALISSADFEELKAWILTPPVYYLQAKTLFML